jgi:putative radical SAM enzyme (TIGR03279 family)
LALFQEIDLETFAGGLIAAVEPGSLADEIGIKPGDALLAINDQSVEDVIDVQYYGAEETVELLIRRDSELLLYDAQRDYGQSLGLIFAHPTFDIDIRRCNNLCEFCFVLQMAPRFRRTLYIKDDDYRYSFLFGHFVTLTNLSDHDWWRIETMRLSPLYVSVHVTDLAMRRRFLRNEAADDIIDQLRRLIAGGIEVHTQLVIVPGVNDGAWLARSIDDLARLWPGVRSISVVPVGLTRQHKYNMRPHTSSEAAEVLDYVLARQPEFLERFGVRFVYPTDEWYLVTGREVPPAEAYDDQALMENGLGMVRHFLDDWTAVQEEIQDWLEARAVAGETGREWPYERLTLVTATLFAAILSKSAAEFSEITGVETVVTAVPNAHLGDTITVAGLLMAEDVIAYLQAVGYGDLIVLPRVMFDHPDTISLDDLTPQETANRLGRPVALADTMGDVWDVLTGDSLVMFRPENKQSGTQQQDPGIMQPPEDG